MNSNNYFCPNCNESLSVIKNVNYTICVFCLSNIHVFEKSNYCLVNNTSDSYLIKDLLWYLCSGHKQVAVKKYQEITAIDKHKVKKIINELVFKIEKSIIINQEYDKNGLYTIYVNFIIIGLIFSATIISAYLYNLTFLIATLFTVIFFRKYVLVSLRYINVVHNSKFKVVTAKITTCINLGFNSDIDSYYYALVIEVMDTKLSYQVFKIVKYNAIKKYKIGEIIKACVLE